MMFRYRRHCLFQAPHMCQAKDVAYITFAGTEEVRFAVSNTINFKCQSNTVNCAINKNNVQ